MDDSKSGTSASSESMVGAFVIGEDGPPRTWDSLVYAVQEYERTGDEEARERVQQFRAQLLDERDEASPELRRWTDLHLPPAE